MEKASPELISKAKDLRKHMTREERKLWFLFLSKHKLKWYRQKIIGNYIVDFYCRQAMTVIELDGSYHYAPLAIETDARRSEYLRSQGLKVLRFDNEDVYWRFQEVCDTIDAEVSRR